MLGQQFGENHLLREKFGGDDKMRLFGSATAARGDDQRQQRSEKQARHLQLTRKRRSRRPSRKSASKARIAAGMAPARMTASLTIATPRKMKVPRPPAPMAAAMVATPMVMTAAVRMPAMMKLLASGRGAGGKIRSSVIPIPFAASSSAGSTLVSPT